MEKKELIKNYAFSEIPFDKNKRAYEYKVIEPKLTSKDVKVLEKIKEFLENSIEKSPEEIKGEKNLYSFIESKIKEFIKKNKISLDSRSENKIKYYVFRDFIGLGKIEPIMHDEHIEDINCNGVGIPIFVRHKRYGNLRTNIVFETEEELINFIIKLAQRCNKFVTYTNPFLEGTLPSGDRVQANIASDVSTRGPTFTIRKFNIIPYSPIELMEFGSIDSKTLAYLWYLIEKGRNILIIGGAASGKTTLLNAIALFIPEEAKIVSIEDTREIKLYHENWTSNVTRPSIGGLRIGEVDLFTLLKESFRQNPDYIIVGEVRGKETYVMFQGMAAGHPTLSTMHAEDTKSLVSRLITKPIELSPSLVELLDVVITLIKVKKDGEVIRRVKQIDEIKWIDEKNLSAEGNVVVKWNPTKDNFEHFESWLLKKIADEIDENIKKVEKDIDNRARFLENLKKKGIKSLDAVAKEIKRYRLKNKP